MRIIERRVSWGHWGIFFFVVDYTTGEMVRGEGFNVYFGVGARGPCDGFIGSPEREAYVTMCQRWTKIGEIPEGAQCAIDQRSLHDPRCPNARWVDGLGWRSPEFVNGAWTFASAAAAVQP